MARAARPVRTLPVLLLATALVSGCGGAQGAAGAGGETSGAGSSPTAAEVRAPARVEAHDGATVDVLFRPPEGAVFTAGYPVELQVDRPFGDTIAETMYGVRDVHLREEESIVFQIRIAPTVRGRTDYTASFRHSVCYPGRCEIVTLPLGWTVEVAPAP